MRFRSLPDWVLMRWGSRYGSETMLIARSQMYLKLLINSDWICSEM